MLNIGACICLVDPVKLKDSRYTTHENFIDQIALSDVLVANKMDLADQAASQLFHQWANNCKPDKALIATTTQGQLDVSWLDMPRNPQRKAAFPNAHKITKISSFESSDHPLSHKADGYQSSGHIFSKQTCFDYDLLNRVLNQLNLERIKGILNTDQGWFIVNGSGNTINYTPTPPSSKSRIETISRDNNFQAISKALSTCKIEQLERI